MKQTHLAVMSFPLPARFHHLGQLTGLIQACFPVYFEHEQALWGGGGCGATKHLTGNQIKQFTIDCSQLNLTLFTEDPVQDVSFSVLP